MNSPHPTDLGIPADQLATAVLVSTPSVLILITVAALALYMAWTGKHRDIGQRYLFVLGALGINALALLVTIPSLTPAEVGFILRIFREIDPFFGWMSTIVIMTHVLMPVPAIITAIKIRLEPRPEPIADGYIYPVRRNI